MIMSHTHVQVTGTIRAYMYLLAHVSEHHEELLLGQSAVSVAVHLYYSTVATRRCEYRVQLRIQHMKYVLPARVTGRTQQGRVCTC